MNQLLIAAKEICEVLTSEGWRFCIIGGLAVQRWGEPRTTLNVDLTLLVSVGMEEKISRTLLRHFASRIADAQEFALHNRVLLLRSSNGKDIDVVMGALPFEQNTVARAAPVEFAPGMVFPCCTAEDLFVMKVFAGRVRDMIDAESIAMRTAELDKQYIREQLQELSALSDVPDMCLHAERILSREK